MGRYKTQPVFGNRVCPICRKPFEQDAEVGPVPACKCGERNQGDLDAGPFPTDNDRMMNAKWSGPENG